MTWRTDLPPPKGQWLVVDEMYRIPSVASYDTTLGWCIRGRWLGHDAVECWQAIEALPPAPKSVFSTQPRGHR